MNTQEFFTTRDELLERLKNETKVLSTPALEHAFETIDRADFMTDEYRVESYEDYPVPIGHGQTISQPTTVAFMLELLDPQKGDRVLDVGSGSGYTTALLADMVGDTGTVVGVEIVPELVAQGQKGLAKYNFKHTHIEKAGKKIGDAKHAPYNRILVNASAEELSQELLAQLDIGGIMVMPILESIWKFKKIDDDDIQTEEFPGFVFVPLK